MQAPASDYDIDLLHGKTPEQVVAMSEEDWVSWSTRQFGGGTPAIAGAYSGYGTAHQILNNRRMTPDLARIRTLMTRATTRAHEAGYTYTGGGTRWSVDGGMAFSGQEQAIYGVLYGKMKPRATQAEVWRAIKRFSKALDENKEDLDYYMAQGINRFGYAEAKNSVSELGTIFAAAVPIIAKRRSKAEREMIMKHFKNQAEVAL